MGRNYIGKKRVYTPQQKLEHNARNKRWRDRNPEKAKQHQRNYREKNTLKLREVRASWIKRNPEYKALADKRRAARSPEKLQARRAIATAVRRGELQKDICKFCGAGKAQAHHNDYNKPLDVLWLCVDHHRAWHRIFMATSVERMAA